MRHPMDSGYDRYEEGKRDSAAEQRAKDAAIARAAMKGASCFATHDDCAWHNAICEQIAKDIEEQS